MPVAPPCPVGGEHFPSEARTERKAKSIAERESLGWRRFGKGRHPAALNLGDCFTYALAAEQGLPVLCTGNDFSQTDLAVLPER